MIEKEPLPLLTPEGVILIESNYSLVLPVEKKINGEVTFAAPVYNTGNFLYAIFTLQSPLLFIAEITYSGRIVIINSDLEYTDDLSDQINAAAECSAELIAEYHKQVKFTEQYTLGSFQQAQSRAKREGMSPTAEVKYETRSVFIVKDRTDDHILSVNGSHDEADSFISTIETRYGGNSTKMLVVSEWPVEFAIQQE